jgi:hypothetical protein
VDRSISPDAFSNSIRTDVAPSWVMCAERRYLAQPLCKSDAHEKVKRDLACEELCMWFRSSKGKFGDRMPPASASVSGQRAR